MALPKRQTEVGFRFVGDTTFSKTVKLSNSNIEVAPEYFSGSAYKESVGGKRISDVRGFRVKINLSYNASSEANTFQDLFNELLSAFRDGTTSQGGNFTRLTISFGGVLEEDDSTDIPFVLEDLSYTQTYRDQIGRFVPSITVCSENILTSIPEDLQGVL
jgi:hypothetical protein